MSKKLISITVALGLCLSLVAPNMLRLAYLNLGAIQIVKTLGRGADLRMDKVLIDTAVTGEKDAELDQATVVLREAARLGDTEAVRLLGLVALLRGDAAEAELLLVAGGFSSSNRRSSLLVLGEALYRQGRNEDAGRYWRAAGAAEWFAAAASRELNLGDAEGAKRRYERAIIAEREDAESWRGLMRVYSLRGDEAGMAATAEQAIRALPRSAEASAWWGNTLLGRGYVEEAKRAYYRSLELDARDPFAVALRGLARIALWHDRDSASARIYLELALERDVRDASLYVNIAETYLHESNPHCAIVWLDRSLVMSQADPWAHLRLGQAEIMLGLTDSARSHLRRALELNPNLEEAANLLRWTRDGEGSDAIRGGPCQHS